jgi:translation initiation factor IF-3
MAYYKNEKVKQQLPRMNGDLRNSGDVFLVEERGLRKTPYWSAQKTANDQDMDLVEVSQKDGLPLCKILNYEKFLYQQKKKEKENKKKSSTIKEIKLSASIGENDMKIKVKKCQDFIENGDKVKVSLQLKGRENARKEHYSKAIFQFIILCESFAVPESVPKNEGNKYITFLKGKKINNIQ